MIEQIKNALIVAIGTARANLVWGDRVKPRGWAHVRDQIEGVIESCDAALATLPPSSAPPGSAPRRGHTTRCQRHTTGRCTCGADEANAREGSAPATVRGRVEHIRPHSRLAIVRVDVPPDAEGTITNDTLQLKSDGFTVGDEVRVSVEATRPAGKEKP